MLFIYLHGHYGAAERGTEKWKQRGEEGQLGKAVNRGKGAFRGSRDVWECAFHGGNSGAK